LLETCLTIDERLLCINHVRTPFVAEVRSRCKACSPEV
jgi:hypothetical protein